MKPRLLDLFCCQGGAGMGYHLAGFEVVGVDLLPQPRYPFEFIQADALEYLSEHGHEFDFIHASPPCQAYTNAQKLQGNEHPDLIPPTRVLLVWLGIPSVIENVPGSPLDDPVILCGSMFELRTYRHRLFESHGGFAFEAPEHPEHRAKTAKMGRPRGSDEFVHYVGNFSGVDEAREDLGVPWMTRDGIRECIPPAYTQYIGEQFLE